MYIISFNNGFYQLFSNLILFSSAILVFSMVSNIINNIYIELL